MHGVITVSILVLSALLLLWYFLTRNFNYWKSKGVLGPKPLPFFGNFRDILLQRTSPGNFLRYIYESTRRQPYVGFFILNKPALLIKDPVLIKNILIKDFRSFTDHYAECSPIADPLFARGLFALKGQIWKELRNHMRPTFTSGHLKMMFPLVIECSGQLKNHMTQVIEGTESTTSADLEVKELMAKSSTDVFTTCAFGINSNCISDPQAEFREIGRPVYQLDFKRSLENISVFFMPWFAKLMRVSFFPIQASKFLREVLWATILEREKSRTCRNDMIDQLILLKNKRSTVVETDTQTQGYTDFSGDDLLAQAVNFFSAGFETSSSTVSYTLFELARAPEIQDRARREICNVIGRHDGQITYEGIQEMKYLDMIISETLRKYPPLPFLDRSCVMNYTVPETGLKIEKGTPVYVSLLGLHYDPDIFPDPNTFDPERFSDENKHNVPSCSYLPFGEGPRICVGMRFAMMAAKTQLSGLLAHVCVLPSPTTPQRLEFSPYGVLLALKCDFSLIFTRFQEGLE